MIAEKTYRGDAEDAEGSAENFKLGHYCFSDNIDFAIARGYCVIP